MKMKGGFRLNRIEIALGFLFGGFSLLLLDLERIKPFLLSLSVFLKPAESLNILVIYSSVLLFFIILLTPRLRRRRIEKLIATNVHLLNHEWYFLIFTTLFSSSLIYWPFFESFSTLGDPSFWAYFGAESSPFLVVGLSLFHWSLPWFTYATMSLIFAFFLYSKGAHGLSDFFGTKLGKVVLLFFLCSGFFSFTSIFVFSNSFLAVIGRAVGLDWGEQTFNLVGAGIVLVLVLISLFLGFNKGIKRFSNFAGFLFFGLVLSLLVSFLIWSPVGLLAGMGESLVFWGSLLVDVGYIMAQFTNQDPFVQNWTAYFWALWLVNLVMISCFIAFISQGRTYGELMRALIVFGLLPSLLPFWILGTNGVLAWQSGVINSLSVESQVYVIQEVLDAIFLPPGFVLLVLAVATLVYNSTNLDSFVFMARNIAYGQFVVPITSEKMKGHLANELYFFVIASLPSLVLISRYPVGQITWLLKSLILLPTSVLSVFMLGLMGTFVEQVFFGRTRQDKRFFLENKKKTPEEKEEIEPSLLGFVKHK